MNKTVSLRSLIVDYGTLIIFGVFLYFYLNLFRNALIDDAFITLRYVQTLLTSGTWGFFPGTVSNSATSPLNILLLSITSLFTGATPSAAFWLYLSCLVFTLFLLRRISVQVTGTQLYGWLAVAALVFNPLLVSTIGLESIVFTALFVLALYGYQFQKWFLLAIALGLLTLTRPEGILFFLVFLLFVPSGKAKAQVAAAYLLCILPWYLFSWIYLGSLVPDTFFIKTEQGIWSSRWDFFNGLTTLYYYVYPRETILSFLFLPLAALLLIRKIREVTILVIIGLAALIHFLGYSLLGVPPFHWYYIPELIAIILLGSLGLGVISRRSSARWQRWSLGLVTAIYFLTPALGMLSILRRDHFIVREMPIHSNWATTDQYKEIGLWLKDNHAQDTIRLLGGEIGALSYYCECRLLDRFSDRRWLKDDIARHIAGSGIAAFLWRVNFAFYLQPKIPPDDYILRAYFADPNTDVEVIKQWNTSTKWIKHGFLILSRD